MDDAAWDRIRLVVFDVDGTLYSQRRLRWRMAAAMLTRPNLTVIRVVGAYRRLREHIGEVDDFERKLIGQTASATGVAAEQVGAIVQDWMVERPLRFLAPYRYKHVGALFDGLRRAGKIVAVLSDYPARDKLAALGLWADPVVYAGDAEVGVLKPNPRGLLAVMQQAGCTPAQTLMIGDRPDRDGAAASRAGAAALIRSDKPRPGWACFARFDDAVFRRFLPGGP